MDDYQQIKLIIAPETEALLEKRRLKHQDIQKTIYQAEQTGEKFVHPETGRYLAGVRPYFVTVWVEYRPSDDGFAVFSAYQHRVKITVEPAP
jgi:hypothetical protein